MLSQHYQQLGLTKKAAAGAMQTYQRCLKHNRTLMTNDPARLVYCSVVEPRFADFTEYIETLKSKL